MQDLISYHFFHSLFACVCVCVCARTCMHACVCSQSHVEESASKCTIPKSRFVIGLESIWFVGMCAYFSISARKVDGVGQ